MAAPSEDAGRSPPGRPALEALDPEEHRLLAYASAIGAEFDFSLLAAALGEDPEQLAERAERLVARGILRERPDGDRFVFSDDKMRAQLYQTITESRRRVIHLRLGQALERAHPDRSAPTTEELGRHFFLGKVPEKAWQYNLEAGRTARSSYKLEAAVHHLERARRDLRSLPGPHPSELAVIDEELGDLHRSLGRLDAADDSYVAALDGALPTDRATRLRLLLARAEVAFTSSRPGAARELSDEALELAQRLADLPGQAAAHRLRARLAFEAGEYTTVLDEAMLALDLLQRTADRVAVGECCIDIALAFLNLGPDVQDEALLWFRRGVEILRASPDELATVRALSQLALAAGRRDPQEALDHLSEARAIALKRSATAWVARTHLQGTEFLLQLGRPDEAENEYRQAVRLLERVNEPKAHVGAALSRGMIAERRGQWEEAAQAFREASELATSQGLAADHAEAEFRRARLLWKTHDLAGARAAFRAAVAAGFPRLVPRFAAAYAELRRDLGTPPEPLGASADPNAASGGLKTPRTAR
jgi:tetratricopeptide (TPR) repeat protein